jgi:hypothetical protein
VIGTLLPGGVPANETLAVVLFSPEPIAPPPKVIKVPLGAVAVKEMLSTSPGTPRTSEEDERIKLPVTGPIELPEVVYS